MIKNNHWRVDKRIPIALLITLFFQIFAAIVWATQLNARVNNLEQHDVNTIGFSEKLARIDERIQALNQDTQSIKNDVAKVINHLMK